MPNLIQLILATLLLILTILGITIGLDISIPIIFLLLTGPVFLLSFLAFMVKNIMFPTIISGEQQQQQHQQQQLIHHSRREGGGKMDVVGIIRTERKKTTVIMAGSYNPPHLGHLAMLEYLADR